MFTIQRKKDKGKREKYFYFIIRNHLMKIKYLTIPILFLLCACVKTPTTPETGTLTGMVKLEGQQDHSGISVALYKLDELDTTILRYNREYPFTCWVLGRPISQATEFVHLPVFLIEPPFG